MQLTLKAARVNAGLTQEQVKERTGFARSTITRWEVGETKPSTLHLLTLCRLYGIEPEDIRE